MTDSQRLERNNAQQSIPQKQPPFELPSAIKQPTTAMMLRHHVQTHSLLLLVALTICTCSDAYTPYIYNCVHNIDQPCVNGVCHNTTGVCECYPFYSGDDCNINSLTCHDGVTHCYNGGVCIPDNLERTQFHCDCYKKAGIELYIGEACEIPTFTSCERHSRGDFSFCVNGGTCTAFVSQREEHVACDCSTAKMEDNTEVLAWGDHCEVLHSLPASASTTQTTASASSNNSMNDNLGIIIGLGLLPILVLMALFPFCWIHWSRRQQAKQIEGAVQAAQEQHGQGMAMGDASEHVLFHHPEQEKAWNQFKAQLEQPITDTTTTRNASHNGTTATGKDKMGPGHEDNSAEEGSFLA